MSETITITNSILALKVFKVLGFASITIVNRKSVTKPTDLLFLIASISAGLTAIYMAITYRVELSSSKSEIVDLGNFLAYIAALLISVISMILSFVFRHTIWRLVLYLVEIEEKFKEIGFNHDYKRETLSITVVIYLMLSCLVPLTGVVYIIDGSALKCFLYFYSGNYFLLCIGSATACINGSRFRLITITKACESILHYPSHLRIVSRFEKQQSDTEVISVLIEIYGKLIDLHEAINRCYAIPAMLSFGLVFFYSIFVNLMVYKNLTSFGHLESATVSGLLFSIYIYVFMIFVVLSCSMTEKEAQKTIKITNKILSRTKDNQKTEMLISLNSFIKRNPLKFSCGLFEFDWSLIYTVSIWSDLWWTLNSINLMSWITLQMISSASTNFIILMQFDMEANKKHN